MTFLLLTTLIIFGGICWYLQWNPVEYLSNKLMPPPPVTGQQNSTIQQEVEDSSPTSKVPPAAQPYIPQTEPTSELSPPVSKEQDGIVPALAASPYQLEIHFTSNSTLKVTLDDGFVLEKHFNAGETQLWEAVNKIVLDMPEATKGELRLNGIAIPLPEAQDGRRRLSLPEDLLDIN